MAKSWTTATKTIILLLFLQVPGDLQISLPHRWQAPWRSGSSVDGEMNVRKTCHIYWYLGLFKVMFYFKPMENPWKSTTWLIRESIGNSFSCFGVPWANQSSISVIENGVHLPTVIFYRENCDSLVNHWNFVVACYQTIPTIHHLLTITITNRLSHLGESSQNVLHFKLINMSFGTSQINVPAPHVMLMWIKEHEGDVLVFVPGEREIMLAPQSCPEKRSTAHCGTDVAMSRRPQSSKASFSWSLGVASQLTWAIGSVIPG